MAIATVFAREIASLVGAESAGYTSQHAGIAQLVEHNLAKVGVAGSSPVSRSAVPIDRNGGGPEPLPFPFRELAPYGVRDVTGALLARRGRFPGRGGEIGRRARLKILWG